MDDFLCNLIKQILEIKAADDVKSSQFGVRYKRGRRGLQSNVIIALSQNCSQSSIIKSVRKLKVMSKIIRIGLKRNKCLDYAKLKAKPKPQNRHIDTKLRPASFQYLKIHFMKQIDF